MAVIRSFRDLIAYQKARAAAKLDSALDCEYITAEDHSQFDALFQEVGAVLQGMIDRADTFCPPVKR